MIQSKWGCIAVLLTWTFLNHEISAAPVLTFNEATGGSGLHTDISLGWQFNVLQSITVEGLGWFDENADGLQVSHHVGIWSPAGVLLVDAIVPAGTLATLDGQFRTASTATIVLPPGNGYIVGGQSFALATDSERLACGNPGVGSACYPVLAQTLDPRVQWSAATFSTSSSFLRPAMIGVSSQGCYGPSFSVQLVPEPKTGLPLALSMLGFTLLRRRSNSLSAH
jgi:hypothetical protein